MSDGRVIGIILARIGSSRLPGKSLAEVAGRPLVGHLIERLRAAGTLDAVVLATPDTPEEAPLREAGRAAGAVVFAGAEEDVLDRLYQAARAHGARAIVHIGGDCPFADPALIRRALELLEATGADYVSNILPMTYPGGLDTDAFTFAALERAWRSATLRTTRRHPVAYFYQNREEFRIENFAHETNLGHLRWTLDYPEDLAFVRAVYERLYPKNPLFGLDEILALLEREPELSDINRHLSQYVHQQPAYWDSEGYMADVRADLATVLEQAFAADHAGDVATAAREYALAERMLRDLKDRATRLSERAR